MKIDQLWNVSTALSSTPASVASFSIPALLVDHADVPLDKRYRIVSRSSYATDLTASTQQVSWCQALWGQNFNPASAYIVRWASAATSPYFVRGPDAETTIATWAAVTDGSLTVTTAAGADALTAIDFTGDTTLADVAATIDAKIVAGGVSGARCYVDALDRIYFVDPATTGASATTMSISGGGAGTDLYLAAWLDGANGWKTNGVDAEPMMTAVNAVLAVDDRPYAWEQIGGSVAQVTALSTGINALNKVFIMREKDTTAKTSGTSDASYAIYALSHARSYGIYTEHTTANGAAANQHPDAAVVGEIMTGRDEGSTSFANMALAGLSESGLDSDKTTVIPLTDGERTFLEGKGCDYLIKPVNPGGSVHLRNGLSYGGQEMRIIIARDWFNYQVMLDIYAYMLARPVVTFSDVDLKAIEAIIRKYADILVERKALEADYTIDMPLASSFSATTKATHTLTLTEVMQGTVQFAINDGVISMSWAA